MEGWDKFIESIKYAIEYGLHCDDLTKGEIEEDICFAIDVLAKENGIEPVNWESW